MEDIAARGYDPESGSPDFFVKLISGRLAKLSWKMQHSISVLGKLETRPVKHVYRSTCVEHTKIRLELKIYK